MKADEAPHWWPLPSRSAVALLSVCVVGFALWAASASPPAAQDPAPRQAWRAVESVAQDAPVEFWASSSGEAFHLPSCAVRERVAPARRLSFPDRDAAARGRAPCRLCAP